MIRDYEELVEIRKEDSRKLLVSFLHGLFVGFATLFVYFIIVGNVHASEIRKDRAVYAIIGESENQGYQGMLAVACAIRNRGTLHGVYGENAPRVKKHLYGAKIFVQAVKAWEESSHTDITNGATHWENIKAFGKPSWARKMVGTITVKDHVFYKEVL